MAMCAVTLSYIYASNTLYLQVWQLLSVAEVKIENMEIRGKAIDILRI